MLDSRSRGFIPPRSQRFSVLRKASTSDYFACRAGEASPAQVILQTAEKLNADLIMTTTDGPDGFLDGLRGTTSERVLSNAKCPVGNLPVDSMLG